MPWVRRLANRWMSRCLSDLTGEELPDSQCGFRLVHLETVLQLPVSSRRFEIESETLVAFLAAGERVEFVPIEVIYESGRSNICPCRDTWRWLRWRAAQQPALWIILDDPAPNARVPRRPAAVAAQSFDDGHCDRGVRMVLRLGFAVGFSKKSHR